MPTLNKKKYVCFTVVYLGFLSPFLLLRVGPSREQPSIPCDMNISGKNVRPGLKNIGKGGGSSLDDNG